MRRSVLLLLLVAAAVAALAAAIVQAAPPQSYQELSAMPRISQAEFRKALAAGTILVLDVRDAGAYANGHIPGAISLPLDELEKHANNLKGETRPIVAYCA